MPKPAANYIYMRPRIGAQPIESLIHLAIDLKFAEWSDPEIKSRALICYQEMYRAYVLLAAVDVMGRTKEDDFRAMSLPSMGDIDELLEKYPAALKAAIAYERESLAKANNET